MLGSHPRFVGLGEAFRVIGLDPEGIARLRSRTCACGVSAGDCELWGPVTVHLQENGQLSIAERYQALLSIFHDVFGEDQVPVDSSKSFNALDTLAGMPEVGLKVLFPIRDVRAWTVSVVDAAKKRREFKVTDILRPAGRSDWKAYLRIAIIRRIPSMHFWEWYVQNRRIKRFLEGRGISFFRFGYEELTLHPSALLPEITGFLDVPQDESMLSLQNSRSHVVRGNRMAFEQDRRTEISYDDRWFRRRGWVVPSLIYPHIMRYNSNEVYYNTNGSARAARGRS